MPDRENKKLILRIAGSRVTAHNFEEAVKSFFRIVSGVGEDVSGEAGAIEWIVSVREGSSLIEATPEASEDLSRDTVDETLWAVLDGLKNLESGADERPDHFSDQALKASQSLAKVRGEGVEEVSLSADGQDQPLSDRTVATVESLLQEKYSAIGSIEGTLQSISLRGTRSFNVYQPPSDHRVECTFTKDKLSEVRDALNSRVSIWGEISYRRDGTPVRMKMRELRVLQEGDDLPGIYDVLGILKSPANE